MKKLTIEEKARAYDEAFERARKLKENPQMVFYEYSPKDGDTICDYIFPELKESEDEKIRKPKCEFEVGDWITFYGGEPLQIIKIERELNGKLDYLLLNTSGHDSYYDKKYVDKNARLWTINDAKPGDVLATDKSVFIFYKVLYDKPYAYCGVDKFGVFKDSCLENNWTDSVDNIYPATKEQRDQLKKAMADAGYTFGFEKKS